MQGLKRAMQFLLNGKFLTVNDVNQHKLYQLLAGDNEQPDNNEQPDDNNEQLDDNKEQLDNLINKF